MLFLFNDDEAPQALKAPGSGGGLGFLLAYICICIYIYIYVVKPGSIWSLVTLEQPATLSLTEASMQAGTVKASVVLRAAASSKVREGLDLVVVLDVGGDKIMDSVKKAMQFVLMKLTPYDRLSVVVTFSDGANELHPLRCVTPAAQKDIGAIVSDLKVAAGGIGTETDNNNIWSGLEMALEVVEGRAHTTGRSANIFLVSDGHQQTADCARQIVEPPPGVAVYTFGIGKDADHQLLADIAKSSTGGTFSIVPDAANLARPLSQLLGGLLTVVAQDVKLILTPKTADNNNNRHLDKMVVAPGTDYAPETDSATGAITIKFGTLFAGEVRKVAVEFTLLPRETTMKYDAIVAWAQHLFTAQGSEQARLIPVEVGVRRSPNPVTAYSSANVLALEAEVARRQHAGSIGEARKLADGRNLDDARRKLTDALKRLDSIVVGDDAQKQLVDMLRDEVEQLLSLMASQETYEAQGRAYALASDASHGRQRFGDRGDDAVRLFATPRMNAYLEQAKQFDMDPTKPLPSAADDVNKEFHANPIAAIASDFSCYIHNADQALQQIQKIFSPAK